MQPSFSFCVLLDLEARAESLLKAIILQQACFATTPVTNQRASKSRSLSVLQVA
jgi:hypothetical protein